MTNEMKYNLDDSDESTANLAMKFSNCYRSQQEIDSSFRILCYW